MAAARYRTEAQKKRRQQVAAAPGPSSLHNMREEKNRKTAIPDFIFGFFVFPTPAACKNPTIRRQTRRLRPNTGFVFWPGEMWRCFEDWRDGFFFKQMGKRHSESLPWILRGFLHRCPFLIAMDIWIWDSPLATVRAQEDERRIQQSAGRTLPVYLDILLTRDLNRHVLETTRVSSKLMFTVWSLNEVIRREQDEHGKAEEKYHSEEICKCSLYT